jgi:glycosyltransferase involved in cell wall biosynthesis
MTTGLRIVFVLKTSDGGMWILPQIEELRRRGHQVLVVLPPGPGRLTSALAEREFEVIESPFDFSFRPNLATLRGLARLRQLLRRLGPDVVKYHMYPSALAARLSTLGLPLRRIHMIVSPLFLESAVVRRVERWLWSLDHVTICGTDYASRRYGELGCPSQRRPVVTCGANTDHYAPTRSDRFAGSTAYAAPGREELRAKARAELGIEPDAFLAIMVSYVYPPRRLTYQGRCHKGHAVLLEAWRSFHARHPQARLLLVGGGWTEKGAAHRIDLLRRFRIHQDRSVRWIETTSDVRPCYQAADLSVSPSLSEGHGAAVEASAMGLPSIVSDAGGLPEVVDGSCGWVTPRGDPAALDHALEAAYREFEAGRLARRGEQARRRAVDLFDNRAAAVRVADIVERVAAGK